jgi:formylglycine-generating enzyme required for sulfatase activity
VDVYYDVSGGVAPYMVSLEGSEDGGETWTLPVTSVRSGHVGSVSTAGNNRVITWEAGADWAEQVGTNVRFRVNVTDSFTPPAQEGFAFIPGGSFQMGDQSDPLVGSSDELPVHSVYVSGTYMGRYEVTKEPWDEVRAWGLNNGYTDLPVGNGSYASKAANHPVHPITWYAMVKWCNARSQKEGLTPCYTVGGATYKTGDSDAVDGNWGASGYRLPSEAEWEKAARGGLSGKRFPWGETINHSNANYMTNGSAYSYDTSPYTSYTFHPTYNDGLL